MRCGRLTVARNDDPADTQAVGFVLRHRAPFGAEGYPSTQARPRRSRHPFQAARPRRSGSTRGGGPDSRHQLCHRSGAGCGVGRHGRTPAGGACRSRHRQRQRRVEPGRSADHGRQRRLLRLSGARGRCQDAPRAAAIPEGGAADRALERQQADRRLRVRSLQGDVQHQLRSSAAAPPVADPARHGGDVRRRDRARADLRLPQGGRAAPEERARARRIPSRTPSSWARPAFSTTPCDSRTSSCVTRSST